jgi:hypothetical protein
MTEYQGRVLAGARAEAEGRRAKEATVWSIALRIGSTVPAVACALAVLADHDAVAVSRGGYATGSDAFGIHAGDVVRVL